jgi:hypothetical protein
MTAFINYKTESMQCKCSCSTNHNSDIQKGGVFFNMRDLGTVFFIYLPLVLYSVCMYAIRLRCDISDLCVINCMRHKKGERNGVQH